MFVGLGTPAMADDFRAAQRITSPVWADLKKQTYRKLPFTRGLRTVLNARSALNAARALSKGHIQGRSQGLDTFQNGGVLVVDGTGACVYAHFSEVSGDLPPMEDVLAAARQLERPNTRSKI